MEQKKKTITIGATEYAKRIGVSKPAIMYRIKNGRVLPGVVSFSFDMVTKKYVFEYDPKTTKEQAVKYFQDLTNFQRKRA